jgi:hypothetical protein
MGTEIALIAQYQLVKWQRYAMTEPTQVSERDGEIHRICIRCGQSICTEMKDTQSYIMSLETILSLLVAHLRQNHMELEPEVYGDE